MFREDLFYRLNVVHFELPPLRERPEDVEPLASLFLDRCAARTGRAIRLDGAAVGLLTRQAWTGNVRELQNVMERAAALAERDVVGLADLEPALAPTLRSPQRAVAELAESELTLEQLEKLYIERVLQAVDGRIGVAARVLGIHRKTLLEKRKRYGLD
jgi:two-component system response regulator HydG